MNRVHINEHTKKYCWAEEGTLAAMGIPISSCGVKYLLFQINYEFQIVSYNQCFSVGFGSSRIDFVEALLETAAEAKQIDSHSIIRGNRLNEEAIEILKKEECLSQVIKTEVCYSYEDNARREFGFTLKHGFLKYLQKRDGYADERKATLDFIKKEIPEDWQHPLKEQLENLYDKNQAFVTSAEIMNLTDFITKKILKHE